MFLSGTVIAQTATAATSAPRRVEILFLGAPTANHPGHDPVERYRVLKKALGVDGISLTYSEDLGDLRRDLLDQYDGVMFYANWNDNGDLEADRFKALTSFIDEGGAFLPIHCASACFGGTDDFAKLVGGHFKSHGEGVFKTTIVAPEHPVMRGYEGFETWDETYVHDRLTDDRTVLQVRENEPWTWVRDQGKGKVFYTAYGHDMRCWDQPEFHELLRRGILWSVGAEVRAKLTAMKLPKLEQEEAILPGYRERKTITKAQKPLSPADSMKLAQVPTGFELSLFASEPEIVNPIHITWDHRGRAYVIETVDYPNNLQARNVGHDRVRLVEDTNGDGKADKFTLFADKLSIPTSAVFVNGGLICTNGSDMIFLKDTTGDDHADVRTVLFSGFNMGDTHAGVSNLRYGFDNWIYATIGYSGFRGTVGGEQHEFSTGFFRFKPDGTKLEFLQNTTNNTWGLGFNSDFDILGSTANGNPSWYFTFAKSLYENAGLEQPRTPNRDGNPKFFPSSMDIRQVDQFDRYTSAAGHSFYTSDRFPERYRDRIAFICGPTGKLVGQFDIAADGAGYVSQQLPNNLYSSADGWSGPVQAETGPDGAVWIADWYNIIIQHNPTPTKSSAGYDAKTGRGNAYETPLRDKSMGRIYRVFPNGSPNDKNPQLDPTSLDSLVAGLGHPNLFWRLQAQRLIVESASTTAADTLRKIANSADAGHASLHAFYALQGLGALDEQAVRAALTSKNRGLRRAGIANSATCGLLTEVFMKDNLITAADARELAELFAVMSRMAPSEAVGKALFATLAAGQETILQDSVLSDAWQMAARRHAAGVLLAAAAEPSAVGSAKPVNLLDDPGFNGPGTGPWKLRSYQVAQPDSVQFGIGRGGRNGGSALRITATARADVGAGADIRVKPHTRYRFGGWIRTEDLENRGGRGAMLNIHGGDATKGLNGTTDWTELSIEFDSGKRTEVLLHCLFGGYGGATGTAYFDDVFLHELAGGDLSGALAGVVSDFSTRADEVARQAVAAALAGQEGEFAKTVAATLGAAPAMATEKIRRHQPDPAVHERGLAVYTRTCVACHSPDGKGVPGAFPPLDGSDWLDGEPSVPIRILLGGLAGPIEVSGENYENMMPPHTDLNDTEISDVLTYSRQSWSNDAPPVTPEEVKKLRAKFGDRATPWTAEELRK